jgi:hypothetical protein
MDLTNGRTDIKADIKTGHMDTKTTKMHIKTDRNTHGATKTDKEYIKQTKWTLLCPFLLSFLCSFCPLDSVPHIVIHLPLLRLVFTSPLCIILKC